MWSNVTGPAKFTMNAGRPSSLLNLTEPPVNETPVTSCR